MHRVLGWLANLSTPPQVCALIQGTTAVRAMFSVAAFPSQSVPAWRIPINAGRASASHPAESHCCLPALRYIHSCIPGLLPGEQCEFRCKPPSFLGDPTTGTCPIDNTEPLLLLKSGQHPKASAAPSFRTVIQGSAGFWPLPDPGHARCRCELLRESEPAGTHKTRSSSLWEFRTSWQRLPLSSGGLKDHISIRILLLLRPKIRGIPETMVFRILVFMWSFGPRIFSMPRGPCKLLGANAGL